MQPEIGSIVIAVFSAEHSAGLPQRQNVGAVTAYVATYKEHRLPKLPKARPITSEAVKTA
jgi:hypothetical protein